MTPGSHAAARALLVAAALVGAAGPARAQTATPAPAAQPDERPTGLPAAIEWKFSFDAGWGSFGFANSYYNNPKGTEAEDLSDQWFEGFIRPGLAATYRLPSSSELYAKVSLVGERTYGSAPALYGPDVSSFGPEEAAIGWRSGKALGSDENLVDVSLGRVVYHLGRGFLLWDGAAEGGSRGGYWTNARKAFAFGAVGRLKTGPHAAETFYLDKDDLPDDDTGTRLWGANYEIAAGRFASSLGVTYMKFFADAAVKPGRDGLNVFNVRAAGAPLPTARDVSFSFEYAAERNGDALSSDAWTLEGAYQLSTFGWKPKFSYRYASFEGDDPATAANEAFDPLLVGFSDWGSWWQGEIAGEYFLANSNLFSHQIRAHVTPDERIGAGLIFYDFWIDHPGAYGPAVTDTHAAFEGDLYIDWKATKNVTLSLVTAFANPGVAVKQASGRTKNFAYGMLYVAYSY